MVIPSEWECAGFHGIVWFKFIAFCCSYNLEDSTNNMRFVFYVFSPKSAILCHFWVLCRSRELTGHLFVINLINSVINCSKKITDSASQMCFFLLSCLNSGIKIIFVGFFHETVHLMAAHWSTGNCEGRFYCFKFCRPNNKLFNQEIMNRTLKIRYYVLKTMCYMCDMCVKATSICSQIV